MKRQRRDGGRALAEELYLGMRGMADAFQTALAGGDTNSWDGPLVISVTLIGEATGRGSAAHQREQARPEEHVSERRARQERAEGDLRVAQGFFGLRPGPRAIPPAPQHDRDADQRYRA